jgi:hypothetical protein
MEKCILTFNAIGENSRVYKLYVYQRFVEYHTSTSSGSAPGAKRIVLSDGRPVNRKEKGKYEISDTHEILTSDTPEAP